MKTLRSPPVKPRSGAPSAGPISRWTPKSPGWEEFMELDEVLARIGEDADARLDFQASYPVHG
jgi:hypothetical protein